MHLTLLSTISIHSLVSRKGIKKLQSFSLNRSFDPPIFGDYPQEMREYHGSELPKFSQEEKDFMKNSIDFIGINHYSAIYTKDCTNLNCLDSANRVINGFIEITGERDGVLIGELVLNYFSIFLFCLLLFNWYQKVMILYSTDINAEIFCSS